MSQTSVHTGSKDSSIDLGCPNTFQAIELRRYIIREGEREHFALYFDTYFPEAIQQLGAMALGQFFERDKPSQFFWFRGFRDMDGRALANSGLYYGPVWKEHKATMNSLMIDSDNVLLLRPLAPNRCIPVLPAVDPVRDSESAKGSVIAQIFSVKPNEVDAFAQKAEPTFARYRAAGAREAGVLVTLDAPNNFPQLPIRTDGPYLVWLGIVEDEDLSNTKINALLQQATQTFASSDMLRETPETVILKPTSRSRLRWSPELQTSVPENKNK